jgi:hypothetical protein
MKIAFARGALPSRGTVVVLAGKGAKLQGAAAGLDKALGGRIAAAIKASAFDGKRESVL